MLRLPCYLLEALAQGLLGLAASAFSFSALSVALLFALGEIVGAWRLLGRRTILRGDAAPLCSSRLVFEVVLTAELSEA